jgi:hypothetical protein
VVEAVPMAETVSRQFLTAEDLVRAPVNRCGFMADEASPGQVFLRVLTFVPVSVILPAYLGGRVATSFLELRVQIPPVAGMFVSCECCVTVR